MESVEDEWERELESVDDLDLLFVKFDSERTTIDALIEKIGEFEFDAKVHEKTGRQE